MWSLESEKEKERERERVNDRETEKQRDREKENETEIIYEAKCNSKSNFFLSFGFVLLCARRNSILNSNSFVYSSKF